MELLVDAVLEGQRMGACSFQLRVTAAAEWDGKHARSLAGEDALLSNGGGMFSSVQQ